MRGGMMGRGFGGTAQRIYRVEDEKTEMLLPLKLALLGVVGAWVGISFLVLLVGLIGPLFFSLAAAATGITLWWYWWRTVEDATDEQVRAAGMTATLVLAGIGAAMGYPAFQRMSHGLGLLAVFVDCAIFPLHEISPALWWILVVLPALGAFWGKRPRRVVSGLVVSSVLGYSLFRHLSEESGCLSLLWVSLWSLRLLFVPYCLPPIAFAANVVARNWIEALIGAVWPPQFEQVDLRWSGIMGLLFPRLFLPQHPDYEQADAVAVVQDPQPNEMVELTIVDRTRPSRPKTQRHWMKKPASNPHGLADFARSLLHGLASFSEKGSRDGKTKGATQYGYTQDEWVDLRGVFVHAGLAVRQPNGSAVLEESGWAYLALLSYRAYGMSGVPEAYRRYLDLPADPDPEPKAPEEPF